MNVVGLTGTVTIGTRGLDGPGEVCVTIEGRTQSYIAYSQEPIPRHSAVVVFQDRGGMKVDIEPLNLLPAER